MRDNPTSPLARVLLRVVARGFYQQHGGSLFTLFLLVFINFFWTKVADPSHITPAQLAQNGLRLVLLTVSEPLGTAALLAGGVLYSLKSWHYVAARLRGPDAQFLAYSSTALPRPQQLRAWALVQGVILLPVAALCGYALVVGLLFGHWLVPLLLPGWLLALALAGARRHVRQLNDDVLRPAPVRRLAWLRRWPKPVFSWFLYEVLLRKRLPYALTKAASAATAAGLLLAFADARADARLAGMVALCWAFGHAVLLYQAAAFEARYLAFARTLPHGPARAYGQQALLCAALLLPELLALLALGRLPAAALLLGAALLLRALLYRTGPDMTAYLRLVFVLFLGLLLANLFGLAGWLAVGCAAAGGLLGRYR